MKAEEWWQQENDIGLNCPTFSSKDGNEAVFARVSGGYFQPHISVRLMHKAPIDVPLVSLIEFAEWIKEISET